MSLLWSVESLSELWFLFCILEGFFLLWAQVTGWLLWVGCDWSFLITTLASQTPTLRSQFSSSPALNTGSRLQLEAGMQMCSSFDDVFLVKGCSWAVCEWMLLVFQNSMIPSGLSWEDLLHPLYQKYKNHITWGDQDLLNIIFHYNPGTVLFTEIFISYTIITLKTQRDVPKERVYGAL